VNIDPASADVTATRATETTPILLRKKTTHQASQCKAITVQACNACYKEKFQNGYETQTKYLLHDKRSKLFLYPWVKRISK